MEFSDLLFDDSMDDAEAYSEDEHTGICFLETDEENGKNGYLTFDMNNMAYEAIFAKGHDAQELKNTVLSPMYEVFLPRADQRLVQCFNDHETHIILSEANDENSENQCSRALRMIEEGNRKQDEARAAEDMFESGKGTKIYKLKYKKRGHEYLISYAESAGVRSAQIMRLVPCCPSCHHRMPIGWEEAEAYMGISLLAPTSGGKTTFVTSMMVNDFECLKNIGGDLEIVEAVDRYTDSSYRFLRNAAEKLVEEGVCPDRTNTEYMIPPVFLKVYYKGHQLFVTLYDNSGEVLSLMDGFNDAKIRMLPNMDAHIYMIEPEQLNVDLNVSDADDLDLYTQSRKKKNPMKMYEDYKSWLLLNGMGHIVQKQHLALTICKCDKLEYLPEMETYNRYGLLFEHGMSCDLMDADASLARESVVKTLFSDLMEDGSKKLKQLDRENVSFHCISALGCGTQKVIQDGSEHFVMTGEYAPIRLAEPLVTCIWKKIQELGWDEEEYHE